MLIIRLDAIGDYVLFRNFLEDIRKNFGNRKIVLCGNISWESFALEFDNGFFDHFLPIDREQFRKNPWYRRQVLAEIRTTGFETAVHPVYSRDFYWGDQIIRFCGAKNRVGMSGDNINMTTAQKEESDQYYTQLITDPKEFRFEFDRNLFFMITFLRKSITRRRPVMSISPEARSTERAFAVIFPGASQSWKRWAPENFARVCRDILALTQLELLVCGSSADRQFAEPIIAACRSQRLKDLTGKTTLTELAEILLRAHFLLSNDTSAVHIAAATRTRMVFAVSAGNHFGRFLPYPQKMKIQMHVFFPEPIASSRDFFANQARYYYGNGLDINTIRPETVIKKIKTCL